METQPLEIDHDLTEAIHRLESVERDPASLARAHEKAELLRQEMLKKYGVRELAVEIIREIREAE
jgi:hypothetical protein